MSDVAELLQRLVRIDTRNPPGNEIEAARMLGGWLGDRGIAWSIDEFAPGRANLFAEVRATKPGRSIMFNTHTDVVPTGNDWTHDPFSATLIDGVIWGRGAADSKGSLAAMAIALARFAARRDTFSGAVQLTAVADEEAHSRGAKRFLEQVQQRPDAVIVGEPTDLRLMAAHKGSLRPVIEIIGRASHAALPQHGVNAIEGASKLLSSLDGLREKVQAKAHPLVGSPTIVPVLIQGGEAPNMVPNRCRVTFDRRLVPGETEDAVIAQFKTWLEAFESSTEGYTARIVDLAPSTGGPSETLPDHPFVIACQAGLAEIGLPTALSGLVVNCDMSSFRAAGIPAVVCGPGSPDVMHARDEHITVAALERGVDAYESMARQWLAGVGGVA
ncbi:M20 family metallopeptidase [Rhodoligotrophos defluvii]|uniref:M20 family metallopeptidase n=1 Tax=Rhodoligotrophos defluvii TaxID=2561934 RepID=UPI0010C9CA67|nr:M20 family metallopeptidase [Rhodoligotrophos defluvii]